MRPHLGWAEERCRTWGGRPGGLKMWKPAALLP